MEARTWYSSEMLTTNTWIESLDMNLQIWYKSRFQLNYARTVMRYKDFAIRVST